MIESRSTKNTLNNETNTSELSLNNLEFGLLLWNTKEYLLNNVFVHTTMVSVVQNNTELN